MDAKKENNRRWTQIYADKAGPWSAASLARPTRSETLEGSRPRDQLFEDRYRPGSALGYVDDEDLFSAREDPTSPPFVKGACFG